MSEQFHARDSSLSVEVFERIDQICVEFEEAWKADPTSGKRPKIEAFLGTAEGAERCSLLSHLLELDIEYRCRQGSDPVTAEYCKRFPESRELIESVFLSSHAEGEDDPVSGMTRLSPAPDDDVAVGGTPCERRASAALACPQCGSDIQRDDAQQREVTCANCGSTVELDPKATATYPILPKTIGRFQVIERLGQGSFGVVYKAYDPELDLTVAIKLARPDIADTQDKLDRFLRDARSAARLKHPNIVRAHDFAYDQGVPYIVSEFIDGMTLDERLSGGPFASRDAAQLAAQIAEALAYAHRENVVHRDVKPSNILMDHTGKPYLTDFGLAHCLEDESHATLPGQILGTPAYMSPEQARGESQLVDVRSDIYSLGIVFYELLTAELPFRGRRRMLLHQLQYEEPAAPRRLNDHVPRDLETICLKCLEKEPRNRYPSAMALRDDLDRYLKGKPIQARPISSATRACRWCLRNPLLSGLAGSVVLLLVLLVVVLVLLVKMMVDARDAEAKEYKENIMVLSKIARIAISDMSEQLSSFEPKGEDDPFENTERLEAKDVKVAILEFAPLAMKYVPEVIEALKLSSDPDLRVSAARALEDLGDAATQAIPRLKTLAEEDESPNQEDAEAALEDIAAALEDAIPTLQEATQDENPLVAGEARRALAKMRHALQVKLQEITVEDLNVREQ